MEKLNPLVYTQEQWHKNNHKIFKESDMLKDEWKKREMCAILRRQEEAKNMMREKMVQTSSIQSSSTQQLGDRARDIYKLRKDLVQQIQDIAIEARKLMEQKKRLENVLDTIKLQLMIVHECFELRKQRKYSDLVEDNVQHALKKEETTIFRVQKEVQVVLTNTTSQIKNIMDAKLALEKDWSDKSEAYEIDTVCGHMHNLAMGEVQSYVYGHGPGDAPSRWSTPDGWLQHSKENIVKAKREHEMSTRLRVEIDNLLKDGARDMRLYADAVESALILRISEIEDTNFRLKNHIKQISEEITKAEKLASDLKQAIAEHSAPVKVAQTRLTKRTQRPNVELCRDPVQTGLSDELCHLNATLKTLDDQVQLVEECLKKLYQTRKALQDEAEVKLNSIVIDKERCRPVRERYPPQRKLLGY